MTHWTGRMFVLFTSVLAGCDSVTGGAPELPDGDYRLRMATPRISNPIVTPLWMGTNVELDFSRSGDEVVITASAGSIVAPGTAQRFEAAADGWTLEFALAGREDGFHYWSVKVDQESCAMPVAVDADLTVTPDGLTVPFALCTIRRR